MRREGSDPAYDDLGRLFGREHEEVDDAMAELLAASSEGDAAWVRRAFGRVERLLMEHLHAEETQIFPLLVADFSSEVDVLLAQHAAIRGAWAEIVAQPLPAASRIEALRATMRAHALREESLAYAEAERRISPFRRLDLIARTRRRLARSLDDWSSAVRRSG